MRVVERIQNVVAALGYDDDGDDGTVRFSTHAFASLIYRTRNMKWSESFCSQTATQPSSVEKFTSPAKDKTEHESDTQRRAHKIHCCESQR